MSSIQTVRYVNHDGAIIEYKYREIAGKPTREYQRDNKREQRKKVPKKGYPKIRIDDAKVEQIVRLLEQRVSQRQIAKSVGVARSTVRNVADNKSR